VTGLHPGFQLHHFLGPHFAIECSGTEAITPETKNRVSREIKYLRKLREGGENDLRTQLLIEAITPETKNRVSREIKYLRKLREGGENDLRTQLLIDVITTSASRRPE
jgi:hypothetical protein